MVHGRHAGGDPNYFKRPVDVSRPVRVAVVFDGEEGTVVVRVLGEDDEGVMMMPEFPDQLEGAAVRGLKGEGKGGVGSLFRMGVS
jgi:hypothetical protein